ncbi:MAG: hypothetical protein M1835_008183 [Candelina submexicana]|nr:MAG: hypothetical protein M1835_008183 [Candelina submexicana]
MQEDLSALLSRNLNLSDCSQDPTPQQAEENHLLAAETAQETRPITYSISQHYHHSAHLATPTRVDNPQPSNAAIISELVQHQIDPMSLLPSQFTLFQQAEPQQRLRLLELWRISPPSQPDHVVEQNFSYWPATMEREEEMARLRYEMQMQASVSDMIGLDDAQTDFERLDQDRRGDLTPIEGGDGRSIAEPYILSGYESLSGRDYIQQLLSDGGIVPPSNSPVNHKRIANVQIPQYMSQYNHSTEPVYQHSEMWQKAVGQHLVEPRVHEPLEDEEML